MPVFAITKTLAAIQLLAQSSTQENAEKVAGLIGVSLASVNTFVEHTTKKGNVLRGVVRTDLSYAEAKAIDEYTFKKDGGWFIREKYLGQTQANNEPANKQAEVASISNVKSDALVSDADNGIDVLSAKFKSASTDTGRAAKRLEAKDGAKLLKQTLIKQFPDTKFSVVMSRGTGHGSVGVRWTDGASYDLVEIILNHFEGKGYDGMQDIAIYKNAVDENGNPVDYGLGYVSGHRQYSKGFLEKFLATLPENLKDLVVQHGVGVGGSDDDAYLTNNNEYWVRSRLGDALSSTSTGRYSGSTVPKVQSQPEEDNSHLSLTWEKDATRKIWRSNDGKIITDESSIVGGKKTAFFAVYQDQEEREHGNNYATGESLVDAKAKAEQSPLPVISEKLQTLIDGIKAHGASLGGYDNFKVQYQNLNWNPYKNKIKDIARDLKLAGYPKLGGFKQLFNDYVGLVNVADLPTIEPIKPIANTVITPIQDVQAAPSVEAPELAGKDGYMPHYGWRNNRLKARKYAMALGLSLDGDFLMPVEDIVAKIDAFNLLPTAEREARLLAITGTTEERTQALSIINAVLDENPTGEFKALHDKALNEIKEKIGKPIHQIYKDYDEFDKVFANAKEQAFLAYASRLPVAIGMGSISSSLASDAHRNTSFSPERRGRSEQISFVADMVSLWQQFDRQYNAANEETQARFKEAFASIKSKAAGLKGATLSAASRTASTMITGGSGFNVSRNQKANQVAHNRAEDYLDYLQNKAPNILKKVIRGVVDDSISGQIVDMQKRIDEAKVTHERMKTLGKIYNKKNQSEGDKIKDIMAANIGFDTEEKAKNALIPRTYYGGRTELDLFRLFGTSLVNSNANIKRMEEQLTTYKARQSTAEAVQANDEEIEIAGVKVELNAQDNRIRLFFNGKPDSDTIAALKGSAFKWSPSNSAWQRQMTGNAIRAAETILNDLADRTGQEKGALPKITANFDSINHNNMFVENSHGLINFGEITAQQAAIIGRQAGKIRLPIGEHRANGTGYGLVHIDAKHGAQIQGAGFISVEKFVEYVVGNFEQIWKATVGQLALMAIDKYKHVVFIQLAPATDGDYYQINTAFPVSRDYFDKKAKNGWMLLWDRSEPISKVAGQQLSVYAATPDNKSSQASPIANGQSNDILGDNSHLSNIKEKPQYDSLSSGVSLMETLALITSLAKKKDDAVAQQLAVAIGVQIVKPSPIFETYQDALDWVSEQSKKYSSKKAFTATDLYKSVYEQINVLYEQEQAKTSADKIKLMRDSGVEIGDKVKTFVRGSFLDGQTHYGVVVLRNGYPYVNLNEKMTVSSKGKLRDASFIAWDSRWEKDNGASQDFTLSTYTEAELRTQEAVLKAAEAKRQADEKAAKDKAIADKQVGDFRLSGSSLPSDVAASYGQNDMFVQTRGQQVEKPKNYGDFDVGTKDFLAAENFNKMAESFSDNDDRVGGIRFKVKYDKDHKDHNLKNISPIGYKVIKAMLKSAQTLIGLSSVDIKVYIQAPLFMEGATGLAHDYFVGNDNKRKASISINSKYIANAISGSDESRGQLARLAETIAHELWHIRQHYDKKLISGSGVWTWLGKDYRRIKYENRPWEIEAKKVGQTLSPKVIDDLVGQNLISISDAGYIKKAILNSNYIDYADDESAKYDDVGGFTFTPAIALNDTLDAIMALAKNNSQANADKLAKLLGVTLAPKQELDMFGDPIQSQGFDLFGEPIQDGDDSPVEELPRLAIQELPLNKLTLSEDVPQFKSGVEDSETGVVEALGGKFDRTGVAPIQVWERADGRLEIISGRHRTDLARRSGEKTIPAQVHKESEGFTAKQAMMLDAELNIRDGQGKVKDYVDYFSHSEISEEEADKRGLLARSIGQRAFMIASKGSEELLTLHRNDIISDQAAAYIANIAPNNSAMQAVGLRVLQEHKPLNNALNTIRAVMALTREKGQEPDTFDLFGFDDSALKEAEAMARIASRKQRQIAEQLTAIKGAVKNPKLAAKHGVIVENEADAIAKVQTMTAQKARWDNWSSHADLLAEVRSELNNKLDTVELDEDDYYWLCQEELDLIAA